jgi:alpha-beta hydrolase superfamily lysophospholipase
MAKLLGALQDLMFTLVLTCISRIFLMRDVLTGRLSRTAEPEGPGRRLVIPSGTDCLDAVFVQPAGRPIRAAVLICHGIGEVVEQWSAVQQLLAEDGVASLVFDYSGYGRSSGSITSRRCERDALAAFEYLQTLVPSMRVSMLGFSLGSGICAAILARLPAVHRLILCAAFTSFRAAAFTTGLPRRLAFLAPPIWCTGDALRSSPVPVVIVHGERDQLFPVQMALDLYACCDSRSELVVVPGLSHDQPYTRPQRAYWSMIASHLV